MLVELAVLLVTDLAARTGPQRGCLVDRLVFGRLVLPSLLALGGGDRRLDHHHRHRDVVGILLDDAAHPPVVGEFLAALFQVEGDTGTAFLPGPGLYGELGLAVGFPQHAFLGCLTRLAGVHLYPVGNDERGVEPHPELANQLGILLLVTGQAFQKGRSPGPGNGAEVFDDLIAIHTDAIVGDGDGVLFLFLGQVHRDPEVPLPLQQAVVGQGGKAQFVDCITGVGNQLPQEYFLVGVQ